MSIAFPFFGPPKGAREIVQNVEIKQFVDLDVPYPLDLITNAQPAAIDEPFVLVTFEKGPVRMYQSRGLAEFLNTTTNSSRHLGPLNRTPPNSTANFTDEQRALIFRASAIVDLNIVSETTAEIRERLMPEVWDSQPKYKSDESNVNSVHLMSLVLAGEPSERILRFLRRCNYSWGSDYDELVLKKTIELHFHDVFKCLIDDATPFLNHHMPNKLFMHALRHDEVVAEFYLASNIKVTWENLILAARYRSPHILTLALARNPCYFQSETIVDGDGEDVQVFDTLLCSAVIGQNVANIHYLISVRSGLQTINMFGRYDDSPRSVIWYAISKNAFGILEILLEAGANPHVDSIALDEAFGPTGSDECSALLIKYGVDMTIRDYLRLITQYRATYVLKAALKTVPEDKRNNMMAHGNFGIAKSWNHENFTLLGLAVERPDNVAFLYEITPSLLESSVYGYTPLMYAINILCSKILKDKLDSSNIYKTVTFLLQKGANVNATDGTGMSAISHSCRYDAAIEFTKLLLEYGAKPTIDDLKSAKRFKAEITVALLNTIFDNVDNAMEQ
jgi:hypothetical protein